MTVEHPLALPYIFTDNVYLLPQEKALFNYQQVKPAEPQTDHPPAAQQMAFTYTGGYQKKFLVLVHYPGHDVMEPGHLSALESTFKRKELSFTDIGIVNLYAFADSEFIELVSFFNPEKILILGKNAVPRGLISPPLNQLIKLGDSLTLYSLSFGEMMGNKDNTKAFWEQMKVL